MQCLYKSLSGPFERFSFNFTQGQGHTSMLWDLSFNFVSALSIYVLIISKAHSPDLGKYHSSAFCVSEKNCDVIPVTECHSCYP